MHKAAYNIGVSIPPESTLTGETTSRTEVRIGVHFEHIEFSVSLPEIDSKVTPAAERSPRPPSNGADALSKRRGNSFLHTNLNGIGRIFRSPFGGIVEKRRHFRVAFVVDDRDTEQLITGISEEPHVELSSGEKFLHEYPLRKGGEHAGQHTDKLLRRPDKSVVANPDTAVLTAGLTEKRISQGRHDTVPALPDAETRRDRKSSPSKSFLRLHFVETSGKRPGGIPRERKPQLLENGTEPDFRSGIGAESLEEVEHAFRTKGEQFPAKGGTTFLREVPGNDVEKTDLVSSLAEDRRHGLATSK